MILFAPSKNALIAAYAARDAPFSTAYDCPNNGWMSIGKLVWIKYFDDGTVKDIFYHNPHKSKTVSIGDVSIALLALPPYQIEQYIRPLCDSGVLVALGEAEPDSIHTVDKQPWLTLTEDEWAKVYQAWPEGKDTGKFFGDVSI